MNPSWLFELESGSYFDSHAEFSYLAASVLHGSGTAEDPFRWGLSGAAPQKRAGGARADEEDIMDHPRFPFEELQKKVGVRPKEEGVTADDPQHAAGGAPPPPPADLPNLCLNKEPTILYTHYREIFFSSLSIFRFLKRFQVDHGGAEDSMHFHFFYDPPAEPSSEGPTPSAPAVESAHSSVGELQHPQDQETQNGYESRHLRIHDPSGDFETFLEHLKANVPRCFLNFPLLDKSVLLEFLLLDPRTRWAAARRAFGAVRSGTPAGTADGAVRRTENEGFVRGRHNTHKSCSRLSDFNFIREMIAVVREQEGEGGTTGRQRPWLYLLTKMSVTGDGRGSRGRGGGV